MTTLDAQNLVAISRQVHTPSYDRARVQAAIVHFGVGAFHRSHEAMYIDRVLALGELSWGITGVGTLPSDRAMRDALKAQDTLYTLVTTEPDGTASARVVGSIVDYLFAPEEGETVLERLVDIRTRIVSLTITEGGYGINDATGLFEPRDEATLADVQGIPTGRTPRSPLGFITVALRARCDAGLVPFTVMSCDNIPGNGAVARAAIVAFAGSVDPDLAAWIDRVVRFPSSMVDRITPATTTAGIASVLSRYGIDDRWPVLSESFEQWVLEDTFTDGRPPFEQVGVQIVSDVEPYEIMKLRLLNASHQAMGYLGLLSGAEFVHEVCRDKDFYEFLLGYMREEARPTLQPVPGIDLDEYCAVLMQRFGSEAIADTLARQVFDGSERIPKFLLPVVREQLRTGGPIDRSVLVLAAWSRFIEGVSDDGRPLEPVDRALDELKLAVGGEVTKPGSFLDYIPVFGALGANDRLRHAFVLARRTLAELGARQAMQEVLVRG